MRQESIDIALAFLERKPKRARRTHTDGEALFLHGNQIAWHNDDGSISLTLAGWPTVTTRERLNCICQIAWGYRPYRQQKERQYWNSDEIDSHQVITVHNIMMQEAA